MGRVFFNTRLNFQKIDQIASYQCLASDSGKTFLVHPVNSGATAITLPTLADAGEGWYCSIVITEDTDGTVGGMNGIVNIDFGSGNDVVGMMVSQTDVAGDYAVNNDDFINFTAAASPGDKVDIFTDGNRWYAHGMAVDATPGTGDVLFNTAAAS